MNLPGAKIAGSAMDLLGMFQGKRLGLAIMVLAGTTHQVGKASLTTAILMATAGLVYGTWVVFDDASKRKSSSV